MGRGPCRRLRVPASGRQRRPRREHPGHERHSARAVVFTAGKSLADEHHRSRLDHCAGGLAGRGAEHRPRVRCAGGGLTWRHMELPTQESNNGRPNPMAICGSSDQDVHVATFGGVLYHWDGEVWTQHDPGLGKPIGCIRGRAADDVYAVGYGSTILHLDGRRWRVLDDPDGSATNDLLTGIAFYPSGEVLISGKSRGGRVLRGSADQGFTVMSRYGLPLIGMAEVDGRLFLAATRGRRGRTDRGRPTDLARRPRALVGRRGPEPRLLHHHIRRRGLHGTGPCQWSVAATQLLTTDEVHITAAREDAPCSGHGALFLSPLTHRSHCRAKSARPGRPGALPPRDAAVGRRAPSGRRSSAGRRGRRRCRRTAPRPRGGSPGRHPGRGQGRRAATTAPCRVPPMRSGLNSADSTVTAAFRSPWIITSLSVMFPIKTSTVTLPAAMSFTSPSR